MKQNIINSSRKGWVDALRGLAILLVMYGHCVKNMPAFFVFTSPVKMPLFFAISGYVFSVDGVGWYKFVNQIVRKIIMPWFILGLLPPVLMIPFKGVGNVLDMFLNMLSGKELWFMPCFIIGEIMHYLIRRYGKKILWIIIVSFLCFVLGIVLHRHGWLNYAMFNRALAVQPFFLIGYLFRTYESKLTNLSWCWIRAAFIVYIGLCFLSMVIFPGQTLNVNANRYYNIPYCLLLIFLGCFILFIAGAKADFHSMIMSFIGQNTLVLYIWHILVIAVLVKGLSLLGWTMPVNWWTALICVIWACLICGILAILLNRYLPFVVGKKRK